MEKRVDEEFIDDSAHAAQNNRSERIFFIINNYRYLSAFEKIFGRGKTLPGFVRSI
jgi:hypothetical protein